MSWRAANRTTGSEGEGRVLLSSDRRSFRAFLTSPDFETECVMLWRVLAREAFFLVARIAAFFIRT